MESPFLDEAICFVSDGFFPRDRNTIRPRWVVGLSFGVTLAELRETVLRVRPVFFVLSLDGAKRLNKQGRTGEIDLRGLADHVSWIGGDVKAIDVSIMEACNFSAHGKR